jgi:hypothetical protein
MKTIHHLMEVSTGDLLRELASFSNKIKELTSADVLKDDGKTRESGLILTFIGGIFSDIHQVH